jgi:hypothetical protein
MNSKPNFPSEMLSLTLLMKFYVPIFTQSFVFSSSSSIAGYPENEAKRTTARPFLCSFPLTLGVSSK